MPDRLKWGIESLSGLDFSGVRVHYGSPKPARINALAYTQGREIHVAPGQERHLPHEAWHIVQQAQGRVRPTMQLKGGIAVNDDQGLEHEADVMGGKTWSTLAQLRPRAEPQTLLRRRQTATYPANTNYRPRAKVVAEDRDERTRRSHVERALRPSLAKSAVNTGYGDLITAALAAHGDVIQRRVPETPPDMLTEERRWLHVPHGKESPEDPRKAEALAPIIEHARARIEDAVNQAKDTIELEAMLAKIKSELGLKAIALENVGKPNAGVSFEVNPWEWWPIPMTNKIVWKMTGTHPTRITKVHWTSDDLTVGGKTAKVGIEMIANPLAPDHEPGSKSTADSSQNGLMGEMPNAGNTSVPNDQKYIKGHLLNDHVGGPGNALNLFPITADANARHLIFVEKFVKAQLDKQNVVSYEVNVTHLATTDVNSTGAGPWSISADFNFYWHLLNASGSILGKIHRNKIESRYNAIGAKPFDVTAEYAGEYDKLDLSKKSPKARGQPGQWNEPSLTSPPMGPMGASTALTSPINMPTGHFSSASSAPAVPDFTGLTKKLDVSNGSEFISVRNNDVPATLAVGSSISVGDTSSPTVVTITGINLLSGGWTRLYF
jgi:hypothetical protein